MRGQEVKEGPIKIIIFKIWIALVRANHISNIPEKHSFPHRKTGRNSILIIVIE